MITFKIRFQKTKLIFSILPVSSKHLSNNAANNLKQNVNTKRYYCHKERRSLFHTTQDVFSKSLPGEAAYKGSRYNPSHEAYMLTKAAESECYPEQVWEIQ